MPILATIITKSRLDVIFPSPQVPSGATGLFIYSGEVSIPGASSFSGTDFRDTLWIPLEAANVFPDPSSAIIGWGGAPPSSGAPSSLPQPIVLPTSWNNSPTTSESVAAINGPSLAYFSAAPQPNVSPGLFIQATVTLQNASLLNAQFNVAILVKFDPVIFFRPPQ
jgi:hypothetical protein